MAISPQQPKYSKQMKKKHGISFPVLSDQGNEYARQLGLVWKFPEDLKEWYKKFDIDLERFNGDDSWELPMAARYIADRAGVIREADVNADYTQRPEPEETVEALKRLAS